jgi:heme exporter protein D
MSAREVDPLVDYRTHLVLAEQKAQEDYDKCVLTLSGGALGISFAFIKDIVGTSSLAHPWALAIAWLAWALSILCVLLSYFASQQALRKAIQQVDRKEIRQARPGGAFDRVTAGLNVAGGVLFFAGVVSMLCFVKQSL